MVFFATIPACYNIQIFWNKKIIKLTITILFLLTTFFQIFGIKYDCSGFLKTFKTQCPRLKVKENDEKIIVLPFSALALGCWIIII
jgi:hypothetical protein